MLKTLMCITIVFIIQTVYVDPGITNNFMQHITIIALSSGGAF